MTTIRTNPMLGPVCRSVREQLPAYTEDRLPQDQLATVRAHLDGCPGCRGERAALEQADALLAAAFADHPWDDAGVEALVASLPARAPASAPGAGRADALDRPRFGGAVGIAAAAVVIAALALALRASTSQGKPDLPGLARPAAPIVVARAGAGIYRLGEAGGESLAAGAELRSGDRLVAVATPALVQLEDGTRVQLHADTEIALRQDADGGLTVALSGPEGEVYVEARPRRNALRVAARGLDVTVLGTRFLVSQGNRVSRVVVVDGRVMARSAGEERVLMTDEGAESHEGELALRGLRVTGSAPGQGQEQVWGSWVPGLQEELARRLDARQTALPPAPPSEPVLTSPPAEPAGPTAPDVDMPIVPPAGPGGPEPLGPR